jgi:hypothetical protein
LSFSQSNRESACPSFVISRLPRRIRCDTVSDKIKKLGAKCFAKRPEGHKGFYEIKFHGPARMIFDIADHPWGGSAPLEGK